MKEKKTLITAIWQATLLVIGVGLYCLAVFKCYELVGIGGYLIICGICGLIALIRLFYKEE